VVIAFFNDEALGVLMRLTRDNAILKTLLALVPLNMTARIVMECVEQLRRCRSRKGDLSRLPTGLYHEELDLPETSDFTGLTEQLTAGGYRTVMSGPAFFAWRGYTVFPARLLLLVGALMLSLGIFLSLTTRLSTREAVVEGEPLPQRVANGTVEMIRLEESAGFLLNKNLAINVTLESDNAMSAKEFHLYPPGRVGGEFLYPRYLGVAPQINFSAPDLQPGISIYYTLMLYPPGKEDSAEIPGTPYKLYFTLVPPADADPYITGKFVFHVKVLKAGVRIFEDELPVGGRSGVDGYSLSIPDARKIVAVDFVRDTGVPLVWGASIMLLLSVFLWLPLRFGSPRREILLLRTGGRVHAYSRSEGKTRLHAGVFHEALDLIAQQRDVNGVHV
jgi:hypothetical protein